MELILHYKGTLILYISLAFLFMVAEKTYAININTIKLYYQLPAKLFLLFVGIVLTTLSGLRDVSVGTDSIPYVSWFLNDTFINIDWIRVLALKTREPLLVLLNSTIRILTENYHIYFFIVYAFVTYAAIRFISASYSEYVDNRHIRHFYLPLILVIVYYIRFWNLLRAGIAVALLLFASMKLSEGEKWAALFLIVLASLFHYTSVLFIFVWFLTAFKGMDSLMSKPAIGIMIALGGVAITLVLNPVIRMYMLETKYTSYIDKASNVTSYLLCLIAPVGAMFFYRELDCHGPLSRVCLRIMLVRIMLLPLNTIGGGRADVFFVIPSVYIISLIYSYFPQKVHSKIIVLLAKTLILSYVLAIFLHDLIVLAESSGVFPYIISIR